MVNEYANYISLSSFMTELKIYHHFFTKQETQFDICNRSEMKGRLSHMNLLVVLE